MIVRRILILLITAVLLVACSSDSDDGESNSNDAQPTDDTSQTITADDPTPTIEVVDSSAANTADSGDAGTFSIQVTGAYETDIPYVNYNYFDDPNLGRYDLRFLTDESGDNPVLLNDLIFVLPSSISEGTYPIVGGGSISPLGNIGDFTQVEATLVINLAPPEGLPLAMNNPFVGEITITGNDNGSLSGTFSIVMGEGDEAITITGQLDGLSGSVLP